MKSMNIGVIGHGVRGRHCLEQYLLSYVPGAHISRVAFYEDSDPVMLEGTGVRETVEYAEQLGAIYSTPDEILADPTIDIISVMIEPAKSYAVIKKALESGKLVLCDKPHVSSVADAERIAEIDSGKLAVFYWVRYLPCVQELERRLRIDGSRVIAVDIELFFGHGPLQGFTMTPSYISAFGGGELVNFGCYAIDIANLLAGKPIDAHAQLSCDLYPDYEKISGDALSSLTIRYENGSVASILTGRLREKLAKPYLRLRVTTENSVITTSSLEDYGILEAPHETHIRTFLAGIENPENAAYPNARQGLEILRVLEMAYRKGEEKK